MANKLTIGDYLRLAKANPTVEKEFEYFKEYIFNRTLVWEESLTLKQEGIFTM